MVRHVAGIAEIVEDVDAAVRFYRDTLGLEVQYEDDSGYAEVQIGGVLHFGIWGRAQAAETIFGGADAADRVPLGFTVGFEVDRVKDNAERFEMAGGDLLQLPKTEPWGQSTARFLTPSGALAEFSETPWARRIVQTLKAEEASGKEAK